MLTDRIYWFFWNRTAGKRPPDFIVGEDDPLGAYLHRWYITSYSGWYRTIPEEQRNLWQRFVRCWPNIYFHKFLRSDNDEALHDHPWHNLSILLKGEYNEHTIAKGGINSRKRRTPGLRSGVKFRSAWAAHRVELLTIFDIDKMTGEDRPISLPSWSLFLTGPKLRVWGFHCRKGWKPFDKFLRADTYNKGNSNRGTGCGELS